MAACQSCPGITAAILVAWATRFRPDLPSWARAARRARARARPVGASFDLEIRDTPATSAASRTPATGCAWVSPQPQELAGSLSASTVLAATVDAA
jgi:hypothetical protein